MGKEKTKSKLKKNSPTLKALNEKQADLIRAILEEDLIIVEGPAGTGKTYIPAVLACDLLDQGKVNKIILTRPNIPSGKSLGYFPGSLEEKMEPWVKPFLSVMASRLQQGVISTGLKNNKFEIVPFETMRGRSFDNCFIFLDEAQNTSAHEMEMFLTRIGEGSTTIINGDMSQSDTMDRYNSGLAVAKRMAAKHKIPNTRIIQFTEDDIVRSGMCEAWVKAFISERKEAKDSYLPSFITTVGPHFPTEVDREE